MTKLIFDYQTGGYGSIYIIYPSIELPDLPHSDWELSISQGFIWYPDYVAFGSRGQLFSYWAKVYLADSISLRSDDIARAILLPFTVPPSGELRLGANIDLPVPFYLPPGEYKLLFETRYVTDNEIRSSKRYDFLLNYLDNPEAEIGLGDEDRPEMCFFTFIPTVEPVEPQIIFPTYQELMTRRWHGKELDGSFDPRRQLVLHNEPSPTDE